MQTKVKLDFYQHNQEKIFVLSIWDQLQGESHKVIDKYQMLMLLPQPILSYFISSSLHLLGEGVTYTVVNMYWFLVIKGI